MDPNPSCILDTLLIFTGGIFPKKPMINPPGNQFHELTGNAFKMI